MLIILVVAHPRLLSAGRPFILRVSRDIGTEGKRLTPRRDSGLLPAIG
jgi:hypothetical protein